MLQKKYNLKSDIYEQSLEYLEYDNEDRLSETGLFTNPHNIPQYSYDIKNFLLSMSDSIETRNNIFLFKLYTSLEFKKMYNAIVSRYEIDDIEFDSTLKPMKAYLYGYTNYINTPNQRITDIFDRETIQKARLDTLENRKLDNYLQTIIDKIFDYIYYKREEVIQSDKDNRKPVDLRNIEEAFKSEASTPIISEGLNMDGTITNESKNDKDPSVNMYLSRVANFIIEKFFREIEVSTINITANIVRTIYRQANPNIFADLNYDESDMKDVSLHYNSSLIRDSIKQQDYTVMTNIYKAYNEKTFILFLSYNPAGMDIPYKEVLKAGVEKYASIVSLSKLKVTYINDVITTNIKDKMVSPITFIKMVATYLEDLSKIPDDQDPQNIAKMKELVALFVGECNDSFLKISPELRSLDEYKEGDDAIPLELDIDDISTNYTLPSMNNDNTFLKMYMDLVQFYSDKMNTILSTIEKSITSNTIMNLINNMIPIISPFTTKLKTTIQEDERYMYIYEMHLLAFLTSMREHIKDDTKIKKSIYELEDGDAMTHPTLRNREITKIVYYILLWYRLYVYIKNIVTVNIKYNFDIQEDIIQTMDDAISSYGSAQTTILKYFEKERTTKILKDSTAIIKTVDNLVKLLSTNNYATSNDDIYDMYNKDSLRQSCVDALQILTSGLMNHCTQKFTTLVSIEKMDEVFGSTLPTNMNDVNVFNLFMPLDDRYIREFKYDNKNNNMVRDFIQSGTSLESNYQINEFKFRSDKLDMKIIKKINDKYLSQAKTDHLNFKTEKNARSSKTILQYINEITGEIFHYIVYDSSYSKIIKKLLLIQKSINTQTTQAISRITSLLDKELNDLTKTQDKNNDIYSVILRTMRDISYIYQSITKEVGEDIENLVKQMKKDVPQFAEQIDRVYNRLRESNSITHTFTTEDFKDQVYNEVYDHEKDLIEKMSKTVNDFKNNKEVEEGIYIYHLQMTRKGLLGGRIVSAKEKRIFEENASILQLPTPRFTKIDPTFTNQRKKIERDEFFDERDRQFYYQIKNARDGQNPDESENGDKSFSQQLLDDSNRYVRPNTFFYEPQDRNERVQKVFEKQLRRDAI